MTTLGIIQARMGATRLPGKVLQGIGGLPAKGVGGIPLLALVIRRCLRSALVDRWVVATGDIPGNDPVEQLAGSEGVPCFRGPEEDVLARFHGCIRAEGLLDDDMVVRVTADDPFKDPELIDLMVEHLIRHPELDYCGNTHPQTWPVGLDVEAMRVSALTRAHDEAMLKHHREHVTSYIYGMPDRFACENLQNDEDLSMWRWTIDTAADLAGMNAMIEYHGFDPVTVGWRELVALTKGGVRA